MTTITVPEQVRRHLEIFACPRCGARLDVDTGGGDLVCGGCTQRFAGGEGIPRLFWAVESAARHDVTEIVKAFYEETPFPNYDDIDTPERLRAKADRGLFARLLNEQIPHGATVLECGCSTGQLSNYLGLTWGRSVFGADLCLNSLRLAQGFKERHGIASTCFVQMNLFRPAFRPNSFDVVISNGVLHHTTDPFGGFQSILRCVKPGGFIVIGLYNRFGRLATNARRLIFRLTGDRLQFLDSRLRTEQLGIPRRLAWFRDQYKHPHESTHTFAEVLQWFDASQVEFVNSIPHCGGFDAFAPDEALFTPRPRGTAFEQLAVQLGMIVTGVREGGFFIMIGRKRTTDPD